MIFFKRFSNLAGAFVLVFACVVIAQAQVAFPHSGVGLYVPKTDITAQLPQFDTEVPRLFTHFYAANNAQPCHLQAQPKAYQYENMALFCKMEVKLEKTIRLPIKMRLGDVPYVDWLEGKRRNY